MTDSRAAAIVTGQQSTLPISRRANTDALEEKRRRDEREAAEAYEQFIASFEEPERENERAATTTSSGKRVNFVKSAANGAPHSSSDRRYDTADHYVEHTYYDQPRHPDDVRPHTHTQHSHSHKRQRREIDSLLKEFQTVQSQPKMDVGHKGDETRGRLRPPPRYTHHRDYRVPYEYDSTCSDSTNLFVRGLPEDIRLEEVIEEFVAYGDLASARLHYPPGHVRSMSALVAFMTRSDAEDAMAGLDGMPLLGNPIKVEIAKPISLPSRPIAYRRDWRESRSY